jgi:glucose-6-phosphate dehydrogenase assembly protein OpcA
MANTYKVLGQLAPSATTATTLYTVPSSTQTVVSTISVANRTSGELSFRIAIRPAGETLATKHYIAYDAKVSGNDSVFITVGATLSATDVITVYASTADLTFNAYGSEIA